MEVTWRQLREGTEKTSDHQEASEILRRISGLLKRPLPSLRQGLRPAV